MVEKNVNVDFLLYKFALVSVLRAVVCRPPNSGLRKMRAHGWRIELIQAFGLRTVLH